MDSGPGLGPELGLGLRLGPGLTLGFELGMIGCGALDGRVGG